jgi:beta-barrel assembly-enhancing protease
MKNLHNLFLIVLLTCFFVPFNVNAFDLGGLGDLGSVLTDNLNKKDSEESDSNGLGGLLGMAKDAFTGGGEIGPVEEYFIGRKIAARVIEQYPPVKDRDDLVRYVNRVGSTVASASTAPYLYRPYVFIVGDNEQVNAFAAPGGIIVITTGMLKFLKNEDELALILGHEIAHVELHHGVKSVGSEKMIKLLNYLGKFAAGSATSGSGGLQKVAMEKLLEYVMNTLLDKMRNGYGVELESEADTRGIELAQSAGYYTPEMTKVITRFKEVTGSYGGASYPEKRAVLADDHVKSLPGSEDNPERIPIREKRYVKHVSF